MSLTKVSYSMISGAPVNVLDFGADPTGVADSTAAIQAALDVGGMVYLPDGVYKLNSAPVSSPGTRSSLGIKSNTTFFGTGTLLSTYVNPGDSDGANLIVANDSSGSISNVVIDGITLKTNLSVTIYNYHMINFIQPCNNITVRNCTLKDFTYWGITFTALGIYNVLVDNNRIYGSRSTGIWVGYEAANIIITNNIVDGTTAGTYGSVDDRIIVANHDTATLSTVRTKNVIIANNICIYTDAKGISVGSIQDCVIDSNVIDTCRLPIMTIQDAVITLGNDNIIISNNAIRNSLVNAAFIALDRFAFWLQGANNTKVTGNTLKFDDATVPMWRSLIYSNNSSNLSVENNYFQLADTSGAWPGSPRLAVYYSGSSSFYFNNNEIRSETEDDLFTTGIDASSAEIEIKNNSLRNLVYEGTFLVFVASLRGNIENNRFTNGFYRGIQCSNSLTSLVIRNNDFDNPGPDAGSGVNGVRCIELLGAANTYRGVVIENNNEYDTRNPAPAFVFDVIFYVQNAANFNNVANDNTEQNNTNRR